MNRIGDAINIKQAGQGVSTLRQPTLREQLEAQLQSAQENIARLSEALSILDEEPRVARLMELLGRSY